MISSSKLKILVFSRIPPDPTHGGCGHYLADLFDYLASQNVAVRFLWVQPPFELISLGRDRYPGLRGRSFGVKVPECFRVGSWYFRPRSYWDSFRARFLDCLKRTLPALSHLKQRSKDRSCTGGEATQGSDHSHNPAWGSPATSQELRWLEQEVARRKPDVLVVNYPWLLAGIGGLPLRRKLPLSTLVHDFRARDCRLIKGEFEAILNFGVESEIERKWLYHTDSLIAVQEGEAALYRELVLGKPVIVARQALRMRTHDVESDRATCVFVGSGNETNAAAVRWFLDTVWPLVSRDLPDAEFHVAGDVCRWFKKGELSSNVVLAGRVDSLREFYASASVVVVPLLRGSGIKIKLLEAVAHQRPVLTTSVGLDGLEFLKEGVRVADDPESFASQLSGLLRHRDLRSGMVGCATQIARAQLTQEVCYGPFLDHLRYLGGARHLNGHAKARAQDDETITPLSSAP
jgi:glycosyltransferase involved in cell wall biosynthesis